MSSSQNRDRGRGLEPGRWPRAGLHRLTGMLWLPVSRPRLRSCQGDSGSNLILKVRPPCPKNISDLADGGQACALMNETVVLTVWNSLLETENTQVLRTVIFPLLHFQLEQRSAAVDLPFQPVFPPSDSESRSAQSQDDAPLRWPLARRSKATLPFNLTWMSPPEVFIRVSPSRVGQRTQLESARLEVSAWNRPGDFLDLDFSAGILKLRATHKFLDRDFSAGGIHLDVCPSLLRSPRCHRSFSP